MLPEYTISLLIFVVPGMALSFFFYKRNLLSPEQRHAMFINVFVWSTVGFALDLAFARNFFVFPDPTRILQLYIMGIPIEEFVFYVAGEIFIVELYIFCDKCIVPQTRRVEIASPRYMKNVLMASFSWRTLVPVLLFLAAIVWLKSMINKTDAVIPGYMVFLTLAAYVPAMLLWKIASHIINRQAFLLTTVTMILISLIWEVTLALPRGYWGYKSTHMLGIFIPVWSHLPIEAVTVWLFCPVIALSYEITQALMTLRQTDRSPRLALAAR